MKAVDIRYIVGEPNGPGPIKILCPFHDERTPSFTVYADGAKCWGCGKYLTVPQFLSHYGANADDYPERGRDTEKSRSSSVRPVISNLAGHIRFWHQTLHAGPRQARLAWFGERGFTEQVTRKYAFGHTGDHFVIPYTDPNTGQFTGYKWRADPKYCDPDEPKYRIPRGQASLIYRPNPGGGPLVVTEGELDAALVSTLGVDALTCGAASVVEPLVEYLRTSTRGPVYIATDPDEAGENAAQQIGEQLSTRAHRLVWSRGDLSDYLLGFDPEERPRAIRDLIQEV